MSISNLGHMKFKRELTPLECKIVQETCLTEIVELEEWWLAQGQFGYASCNLIFEVCEKITAVKVFLNANQQASIIKEIYHIDFPNLIVLHLSGNNIESLEHLPYLKAQNLQNLFLSGNSISEARSLRKCNFPRLNMLSISDNRILNISFLPHCSWSKNFQSLGLQQDNTPQLIENITPIFKLQSKILTELFWNCDDQEVHYKFNRPLEQRFQGIRLNGNAL